MHRRSILVSLFLLTGLTTAASSDEAAKRLATAGDPQRGITPCASCHRENGGGSEEISAPRLAAVGAGYLAQQLRNFKNGNRKHPVMDPFAELLTDAEMTALGEHYAAMSPASNAKPPEGIDVDAGKWIALYGDWSGRRLPGCVQCHGPLGIGVGERFPALAGQPYQYILGQLAAWYRDERTGDPLGMMADVTGKLTKAEAKSVAAFYASLPAAKAVDVATDIAEGEVVPDAAKMQAPGPRASPAPIAHEGPLPHHGGVEPGRDPGEAGHFEPPARCEKPDKELGEMVALGEAIFMHTNSHEIAGKYVGNDQVCEGCHLDAGRLADSAPMWASWVSYPAYRKKTKAVNTIIERVQGCFKYSMNAHASEAGHAPAAESRTIRALISYMYWLATGAPTGDKKIAGRGYPKLAETTEKFHGSKFDYYGKRNRANGTLLGESSSK